MKWPLFEKIISKRLAKREAEVDVDALWAAIEPEVDAINRSKRRGLGWWWPSIGGGLLAMGLVAWVWWGVTAQPTLEALPIMLPGEDYAAQGEEGIKKGSIAFTEAIQTETQREIEETQNKQEASSDHANRAHTEVQSAQKNDRKENKAQIGTQITQANNEYVSEGQQDQQTKNNPSDKTKSALPTIPPQTAGLASADEGVAALPTLNMPVASQSEGQDYFPEDFTDAAAPLVKPKQQFRYSVTIQGGAGMTQMKRSTNTLTDESMALLELRNRRERLLEHTQAGLLFNLHHASGLQISTGLHYTQINERYDYQRSESVTIDSVYGPRLLVVNLYDEIDTLYGTVPVEEVTTYTKRYYNRHQMLDLPILLGYQRAVAPRLRIGVQAGGFLNISLRSKGRIASLPDTDVDVQEAEAFRSRIGWSYYLGLLAEYQLSPRIHAYAAPSMRYFPKSFTQSGYPLEQAYQLYTVNIGVRYSW